MGPMRADRLAELLSTGLGRAELAGRCQGQGVVVDLAAGSTAVRAAEVIPHLATVPVVVIGIGSLEDPADPRAELADVVVADPAAAGPVVDAVGRNPAAATSLALLLRGASHRRPVDGLVLESATYSALQAGPEHRAWLAARDEARPAARSATGGDPIAVERAGGVLRVVLNRPNVRNALDAAMRDALLDALAVASADAGLSVLLTGAGPAFCSGGDLDEFGTATDPAAAHLVRLGCSVGGALEAVRHRVTAAVHGTCVGSGLELAAFAGRVVADPGTTFRLPEVAMGLVPGAGGTVSVTRRIGRHRTAWLGLTGEPVDAATALAWGLVDEIAPVGGHGQPP